MSEFSRQSTMPSAHLHGCGHWGSVLHSELGFSTSPEHLKSCSCNTQARTHTYIRQLVMKRQQKCSCFLFLLSFSFLRGASLPRWESRGTPGPHAAGIFPCSAARARDQDVFYTRTRTRAYKYTRHGSAVMERFGLPAFAGIGGMLKMLSRSGDACRVDLSFPNGVYKQKCSFARVVHIIVLLCILAKRFVKEEKCP